jgi:hypothetical protein
MPSTTLHPCAGYLKHPSPWNHFTQKKLWCKGNHQNDRYWVARGIFVNRNDPRLLVVNRSGLGWTFNFAHPIAWWLTGGVFVISGLVQLDFFILFHSFIYLVLLCLFLALCLHLFVGYLRVRASGQV